MSECPLCINNMLYVDVTCLLYISFVLCACSAFVCLFPLAYSNYLYRSLSPLPTSFSLLSLNVQPIFAVHSVPRQCPITFIILYLSLVCFLSRFVWKRVSLSIPSNVYVLINVGEILNGTVPCSYLVLRL